MNKLDPNIKVEKLLLQIPAAIVHFVVMIRFLSFFIIISLLSTPSHAYAQEEQKFDSAETAPTPKADFSELKHTKSGRIDKVIDGLTLLLKDGTIVRLAALDIPDFHIWENADYSEKSLKLLQKTLPEQTEVMLYQTRNPKKGRTTRMEHELAQVVLKKDDVWLQGLLLKDGLARVYTTPDNDALLDQMLKIEQNARKSKIGIWADDSEFKILTPDETADHMGDLVIVEGVIQDIASIRNNLYLNFGKDWKKDFTVMINPNLRKKFAHDGAELMGLNHKTIRVRGYLREYNGPLIELEDSAHLEILQNDTEKPNLAEQSN